MTAGLTLGTPGVYHAPATSGPLTLAGVALDETGFVGVCWRGPVNTPVRVASWSQFVDVFGGVLSADGTVCPGHLPLAVRAYFDQGGRVAWVVRVAPVAPAEDAAAGLSLPGLGVGLAAASEGTWGAFLTATLSFQTGPALPEVSLRPPGSSGDNDEPALEVGADPLPAGSLLLVGPSPLRPRGSLHWVRDQDRRRASGSRRLILTLDPPAPDPGDGVGIPDIRIVTATLDVLDRDPRRRRTERISGLGLRPDHPRYPAAPVPATHPRHPEPVLAVESQLVRPAGGWQAGLPLPAIELTAVEAELVAGGRDRFAEIDGRSLFDATPGGDPLDELADHLGLDAVARVDTLGLACMPDLTWLWRGETQTHHLDPRTPEDFAETVARQRKAVAVAEARQRFVLLLDAPLRSTSAGLTRWRAAFDSSYAAAYHPWLAVPAVDPRAPAVAVPPSAFAAGIIAARERRLGLAWGPANELASGAVLGLDVVPPDSLGDLHRAGINVFHAERDGHRLASARTLSRDRRLEQLSVRRLLTMIVIALRSHAESLVFEPHTPSLRSLLVHTVTEFLRELFRRGAFAGDTEQTSFFVRCDDTLNPGDSVARGRLVAEVGVALSAPLEFLVVRISQDVDGRTEVVATPGGVS